MGGLYNRGSDPLDSSFSLFQMFVNLRASPSALVNSSKIEKGVSFTHFEQKITHISGCKLVYKYTIATIYMHGYCSMCIYYFINFSSHLFFFLFSVHNEPSLLIFFFSDAYKHKHTHTQTHQLLEQLHQLVRKCAK